MTKFHELINRLSFLAAFCSLFLFLGCSSAPRNEAPQKPEAKANENTPTKTNSPAADSAERVEGTLSVNGKPVSLTNVYAWTTKGAFDDKKTDVHVTIVDRPLSEEQYKSAVGLMSNKEAQGLELTIDDEKKIIGAQVYHAALEHRYFSSSGSLVFEPVTFDTSVVEGRVSSNGPHETFGDKWESSVSFRVKVQSSK